jgi:sirohydrochlorin cobaltochelatase
VNAFVTTTHHINKASEAGAVDACTFKPGDGVLLIGHGTRDAQGTRQFFQLGDELKTRLAPLPVEPCLLELQEPTIAQGWDSLKARGVSRVLASPLLLFSAGHAKSDIPDALNQCQSQSQEMTWQEARPLSRAPELLRLVLTRLDESLRKADSPADSQADSTGIVMVGRGSFDPCAQADMKLLTHWVAGQREAAIVTTAFYAMAHPRLPVVLRRVAVNQSIEKIIVQPHLLFEGALYQSILKQVDEVASEFPHKEFIVSGYLGPEPEVANAIVRRLAILNRQ